VRRTEGKTMNKPLVILTCTTLLAISASALAADWDTKPLSQMTGNDLLAARQAAIEHWSKMTPEEREAAVASALDKKTLHWTALDWWAANNPQTLNERLKAKPKPQPPKELGLPNWPIDRDTKPLSQMSRDERLSARKAPRARRRRGNGAATCSMCCRHGGTDRTDGPVADALCELAAVLQLAGDAAGARATAERAVAIYAAKGDRVSSARTTEWVPRSA